MLHIVQIEAISSGPEVMQVTGRGSAYGHVLAVVTGCIYLQSSQGYVVSIVGKEAVNSPLSLRVRGLPPLLNALRGLEGLPFHAAVNEIEIGGLVQIALHASTEWTPRVPCHIGQKLERNKAAWVLAQAIANCVPGVERGLASLVSAWHSPLREQCEEGGIVQEQHLGFLAALRMARDNWRSLHGSGAPAELATLRLADGVLAFAETWGTGDIKVAGAALASLVGLGPGLTPSGDDFVSGLLATLLWQAHLGATPVDPVEYLVAAVRRVSDRTNSISARLLYYGTQGILYAPAMELGQHFLLDYRKR